MPKKGRTPPSLPARSLIEMRDKTTWQITDDIPMWDGTHLFKQGRNASVKFSHDTVASLPRLKRKSWSLVKLLSSTIVLLLPPALKNIHPNTVHGLSLNLYGAVTVASDV
ncbi:hypothetical protein C8Q80DRAFT_1269737 [Daedaleopsis nitida]|nr:hypothetical protein C8Q80DRAFT_1269737 [Daedaleopsis nitida]